MKSQSFINIVLYLSLLTLSSCDIIGGIFNAGVNVGIFIVILVIVLIIYLITRFRRH